MNTVMRLRSYFKTALKYLFLYLVWGKIKSMLWEKTKEKAEKKAKKEIEVD